MEKSESVKELATALAKFQGQMEAIAKDANNPFFKSKYASLSAIIGDTRDLLAKNDLSYAQFPTGEAGLTTILMHKSGEWMSDTFQMKPVDSKPQSFGSAITYARRYALCGILGLAVEDDDGNEASKPKKVNYTVVRKQEPYKNIEEEYAAVSGEPEIPTDITDQKKTIMAFVKQLEPKTDMRSSKAIAQVVSDITQLNLVPANYPKIITLLEEEIRMRNQ